LPADETDRRFLFSFGHYSACLLAACLKQQASRRVLSTNEPLNFYNQGSQC
jgi:hypothetical protein